VLRARSVSKRFAGRAVLDELDLDLRGGEVLGLLGHNGSGKSTFVKILSGFHRPEPGAELTVCGATLRQGAAAGNDPARRPMSFVHQDLALVGAASVAENFAVGRYLRGRGGAISWRAERRRLAAALERFGMALRPDQPVAELSDTDRALLAIARAVDRIATTPRGGVLVLDEPTASLPRDGAARVFAAVRSLTGMGIGVLLVTHNIAEVQTHTDRVVVLRDGRQVLASGTPGLSRRRLIEAMVPDLAAGGAVPIRTTRRAAPRPDAREVLLEVRDLSGARVSGVSFQARAGEIVGLTGLLGSGFNEVPYLLFGAAPARAGVIRLRGSEVELARLSPGRAIRAGLCLVPADRARRAAVLEAPTADNVTLGNLGRHVRTGLLRRPDLLRHATGMLRDAGVQPVAPLRELSTLSGGNQQKAVLAKWLDREPTVLLLDEPVQGVDVASRVQIMERLAGLARAGAAIVLASVETEDLAALCDTVLVFALGRLTERLAGVDLTARGILDASHREAG